MSRIGKKPVAVPSNVTATVSGQTVKVKGPKGELAFDVPDALKVEKTSDGVEIALTEDTKLARSMWGMSRTQVANLIKGVTQGYSQDLEIHGVGFKASMKGKDTLHPVGRLQPRRRAARSRPASRSRSAAPSRNSYRCPASTSRRSGRSPPTSAPPASRSPTRAKACAIRVNISSARKARRSRNGSDGQHQRKVFEPPGARAPPLEEHCERSPAAFRTSLVGAHLCAGDRRYEGRDARGRLDAREGGEGRR